MIWRAKHIVTFGIAIALLFLVLGGFNLGSQEKPESNMAMEDPALQELDQVKALLKDGNYTEAEKLAREILAEIETKHGLDSLQTAQVIDLLVEAILGRKKKFEAESRVLFERAISIRAHMLGSEHLEIATSLVNIANILNRNGQWPDAKSYYERALAIYEKTLEPSHEDIGLLLGKLGATTSNMGAYAEAIPILERSVSTLEKTLGAKHIKVANSLTNLGITHFKMAEHTVALQYLDRALAIKEKTLGLEHPKLANDLKILGVVYTETRSYEKAHMLFERSLAIRKKNFGPDHISVADIYNSLGILSRRSGKPDEARSYYKQSLAIIEKTLGPDHQQTVPTLINLGVLSKALGDYSDAKSFMERALSIQEKTLNPEHPWIAGNLTNLGGLLRDMGDYIGAIQCFERALIIREKIHGPDHGNVAVTLHGLGLTLWKLGDYERARTLLERSIAIFEETNGPEDIAVAGPLNDLSLVLESIGDLAGAEVLLRKSTEIKERAYGSDDVRMACALINKADQLIQSGDFDKAKEVLQRVLMIQEKSLGADSPNMALSLSALAYVHHNSGENKEAITLTKRAKAIIEKSFGPDHPDIAQILCDSSLYLWCDGQTDSALENALLSGEIARDHLRLITQSLSERQALAYSSAESLGSDLDICLSLAVKLPRNVERNAEKAWDSIIRSRAILLDEMGARHRIVAKTTDLEITALAESLNSARQRLANLIIRGHSACELVDSYQKLVTQTRNEKDQAERALAEASVAFREATELSRAGLEEVKVSLPPGFALVAFARYIQYEPLPLKEGEKEVPTYEPQKTPSYLAFILQAQEGEPIVVPLGKAEDIEPLIFDWGQEIARGTRIPGRSVQESEAAYYASGEALRKKVWDPIAPLLEGVRCVLLVPDGALHSVNFAALPVSPDKYVIKMGPLLHYLSAERDLISSGKSIIKGTGLLALGNPAFDETSIFASLSPEEKPKESTFDKVKSLVSFRGLRSECGDFKSLKFTPLPATHKEINTITDIWKNSLRGEGDILEFTGAEASEKAFKMAAPGKQVLHVAAHGFFLEGNCPSALARLEKMRESGGKESGELPPVTAENPLLLSGIALAGANHREAAGADEEDGILTAEEVAALDLSGVDLVILSACNTGAGKIKAVEGVFGLRRAFQIAGAKKLVTSLWAVEDEATRKWMKAFYEALLSKGLGTAESVREASLEVLRERREKNKSTHPFYWAGFVASGDWK
ncbi:MAG: CHAT domain-containing tetratricopeptide repeat protein [Candidatus Aminicenantaceae bacterium]